jgi:hypothetical protein
VSTMQDVLPKLDVFVLTYTNDVLVATAMSIKTLQKMVIEEKDPTVIWQSGPDNYRVMQSLCGTWAIKRVPMVSDL